MKKSLGAKTFIFPTPVWCVGTFDDEGKPNVMTIAWGGICCSEPPCVNVSLRKATYSYANILNRKAFTLNVPSEKHVAAADYYGMVSGKNLDKFKATGLTATASDIVDAPYVEEFPLVLECRLIHHHEIGLHTIFIGEIMDVKADEQVLDDKGNPDGSKIKPFAFSPFDAKYHRIGDGIAQAFSAGKTFMP